MYIFKLKLSEKARSYCMYVFLVTSCELNILDVFAFLAVVEKITIRWIALSTFRTTDFRYISACLYTRLYIFSDDLNCTDMNSVEYETVLGIRWKMF